MYYIMTIMSVLLMPHTGVHPAAQDNLDEAYSELIDIAVIIQGLTECCNGISLQRSCT